MESSESISVSKIDETTQELGFLSSTSPECDQGPPQSDPDVHTNLLHEHLLQSLDLKDTEENQNLHAQTESFDVKETADEAQDLGQKEVTHDEILDKSQNVDLVETHHEETHEEHKDGSSDCDVDGDSDVVKNGESNKGHPYPLRPDAEDCAYYMKTGTCKFGSTCKFNHPLTRKSSQAPKEKVMERGEELTERPGQTECKYYLRTGGCKFGKACRYNHPKGKIYVSPIPELNFLGLPIRLGEKECPYYMRTGSCKYAGNCRFNHPDPTSTGGNDLSGRGNNGPVSLKGAPPSTITSWTSPKTFEETPPFLPMMLQPTQVVPSQTPEWNGYQAPLYPPPERSMRSAPAYVISRATETSVYTHHHQQILLDEFPERPGQPECSYYLKTGDCKFKSNCKYHHPKTQIIRSPPCPLSDKGLPLRPDQNICTHYSRYGICKFGPACKFDHPVHYQGSTMIGFDHPPSYGDTMGRSRSDIIMQQPYRL